MAMREVVMLQQPGRVGLEEEQALASVLDIGLEEEGEVEDDHQGLDRNLDIAIERLLNQETLSHVEGAVEVAVEEGGQEGVGDRVLLQPFFRPLVPQGQASAGVEDADGWSSVDQLGAMDCLLCSSGMLIDVPEQHEAVWVSAWVKVLRKWSEADSEEDVTRALKWLLFLPQGLLRRPRMGGKKGRRHVAARFNALVVGDWGKVVEYWQVDRDKVEVRVGRRQGRRSVDLPEEGSGEQEKLRRTVLSLISDGQLSRAVRRVTSHGVATARDPEVQEQLQAKYPPRARPLPDSVSAGQAVEDLRGLREALTKLQRGVSPGCGGCRPKYLAVLGEQLEEENMKLLEEWGMAYVRGSLPPWFYRVALSVQTVALYKTEEQETVRPLGLRHPLIKLHHKEVVSSLPW